MLSPCHGAVASDPSSTPRYNPSSPCPPPLSPCLSPNSYLTSSLASSYFYQYTNSDNPSHIQFSRWRLPAFPRSWTSASAPWPERGSPSPQGTNEGPLTGPLTPGHGRGASDSDSPSDPISPSHPLLLSLSAPSLPLSSSLIPFPLPLYPMLFAHTCGDVKVLPKETSCYDRYRDTARLAKKTQLVWVPDTSTTWGYTMS